MALVAQIIANSLITGCIYALVACGFSLIFATNRFVHFAHGATVSLAGYTAFILTANAGLPLFAAAILAVIVAILFGIGLYTGVYLQLQKKKSSNVILLIASVAILLLVENLILLFVGADVKAFPNRTVSRSVDILGATVTPLQIIIISVAIAIMIALFIFLYKTRYGRRMRAVADNKDLARVMGINSRRVAMMSFAIGSALAGVAGILIGLEQNLEPGMGTRLMIKGFTGAIIGGVVSVPASVAGSIFLGTAENVGVWYLPSGYKDAIAFGILFIFLLFRPNGLFGLSKGVRK